MIEGNCWTFGVFVSRGPAPEPPKKKGDGISYVEGVEWCWGGGLVSGCYAKRKREKKTNCISMTQDKLYFKDSRVVLVQLFKICLCSSELSGHGSGSVSSGQSYTVQYPE